MVVAAACVSAGASLAACTGTPRPPGVAVVASGADLESGNPLVTVHPLSRQVQRYVLYVTLARYDSALAPEPYLARRWSWSADRRRLTFALSRAVSWHDGRPTTARDAAFTLNAARDPVTGYPRAADLAAVDSVSAPDDSTLVVHFARPQSAFPLVLCELPVVPAHRLATVPRADLRRAAFNIEPLGNGPFVFTARRPGQRWIFRRNDAFPAELGGPPRLEGVVIAVVDEATTKFAGLASGDLDLAGISPTMASLVARDPALRTLDYPLLFTNGIFFNVHRPPFDDVRVRRAVSLAVDRERIIRAALAGYATPAAGPVPPESPFALPAVVRTDTALADSLLDAAGWRRRGDGRRSRDGRSLDFELLTVGSGDNALEQLLQADLAARGIRMEIRQAEMGAFLTRVRASPKDFDAVVTGIPGDVSLAYVGAMFDGRQRGGALDYAGHHSARLDALFEATRVAATDDARRAAWHAVQRELDRELPAAWLYHSRGVQGVARRLAGVHMDLRGELVTIARWTAAGAPGARAP